MASASAPVPRRPRWPASPTASSWARRWSGPWRPTRGTVPTASVRSSGWRSSSPPACVRPPPDQAASGRPALAAVRGRRHPQAFAAVRRHPAVWTGVGPSAVGGLASLPAEYGEIA
ncbi:hypothetical protein FRAHR75_60177 [Frankia sp. Hr75.2]|nr:hypothetical protein FRAHR75_60177 [Frankia sp. Hr75.2]